MNIKNISFIIILLSVFTINAQKKQDINAIKKLCGCFEIDFKFAETFKFTNDSNYIKSKNYNAKAIELAVLVKDEKNHISIQHLLVMGEYIMKHWRQDWIYQNQNLYNYAGDNQWSFIVKDKKEVKGQWTQKVFQVDDSPRYEGSSSWVHVDGKSYWENQTSAPLPRREYTKRSDYNIMIRGNRHEITESGWVHDQDNLKILKKENKENIKIASEKGYNKYTRIDDLKCKEAVKWWEENKEKWGMVLDKWNSVYNKDKNILLRKSVEKRPLYSYLFDENVINEEEIGSIIDKFVAE